MGHTPNPDEDYIYTSAKEPPRIFSLLPLPSNPVEVVSVKAISKTPMIVESEA